MIQIDMQMPKCCDECFALDDHYDYPFCQITHEQRGYDFRTREKRMPGCPLKSQEPRLVEPTDFEKADDYGYLPAWCENKVEGICYWEMILIGALNEKDVRYWTGRPTQEQMEMIPWE